ncbi:hypothetical protein [Tropicimonas sp. IMCC6043]|uniref:hypothetical protein n=1 Tax=Tropicimonas sp. IMCC6043 TaxID=2510645 RepID=UPI00101BB1CD|nr:hypothetical protein [Tropicimonas sp. IMCC6043]RYH09459.1 hypothetical protein EU800_12360 [Tropicimonas sp. IMCC6043]
MKTPGDMESTATIAEQAMAILKPLPAIDLETKRVMALTRAAIQVQERLHIEPYALPTLSDLLIVAKYAQMNAHLELGLQRDASSFAWAGIALTLWDDAVDQSLSGTAVLALLSEPQRS